MTPARRYSLARRIAVLAVSAMALSATDALAQKKAPKTFNVIPITITSVTAQGGQLVAAGNVSSTPYRPIDSHAPGAVPDATCPVLDLSLGPINLSLLGLNVDTSPICLEITAHQGGGLLGDLLCAVANLLNGGTSLADVLAGLTAAAAGHTEYRPDHGVESGACASDLVQRPCGGQLSGAELGGRATRPQHSRPGSRTR